MKLISTIVFVLLILSQNLLAADDDVSIIDPYVRAVAPGQTVSAAFLQLENKSAETRRIKRERLSF